MFQQLINCNFGKCVEGGKKKFSLSSSVYTGLTVQHKMLDLGGAGEYKTTQKNKTNQLLGSPLTDEPEKQETDKWREQLQPHSR